MGTAPIGNLFTSVSEEAAEQMLAYAERVGASWFDTAPLYGHGLAEQRLGAYLRAAAPARRTISTKVGRVLNPAPHAEPPPHFVNPLPFQPAFDYSAAGIRRSLEESLGRLGLASVDIALLHDVDRLTHAGGHRRLVPQLLVDSLPAMVQLKADGLVRAIGLGINEWDIGYELLMEHPLDVILLAGRYTLLDQSAFTSGFLDACARRHTSVVLGGVFNSGLLVGGETFDYAPAQAKLRDRVKELTRLCDAHGVPLPAAALQFAAAHPAVRALTVGARTAVELEEIVRWSSTSLPEQLWRDLKAGGHIPVETPVPETL
ncbi:aldo/keto reductase [Sphingobium tyrosinilyticum]|uniref:Aldo/keto reductase n=1 Tax=Sphingobium tyrosinilyticum TaxID=2715436 RepID=A0ABV9EY19_9SPHN